MQRNPILFILLLLLIPSVSFAESKIETGYDLYHNLKLIDDPQNLDQVLGGIAALMYLKGCFDGLAIMQDLMFDQMFPKNLLTDKERKEYAKKMNFHRLNVPEKGIPVGQMILIFNKYAKKNPEKVDNTARTCIVLSLVEAYGWK